MNRDLSVRKERAAGLLATGKPGKEVAEAVGIHQGTLSQWRKEAGFIALYNRFRAEAHDAVVDEIATNCIKAVATLRDLMEASQNPEIRLKAAVHSLTFGGFHDPERSRARIGGTDAAQIERQRMAEVLGKGAFL